MSERAAVEAIFGKAFRALKPRTLPPALSVEFRPYAGVNSTIRLRNGRMDVRLSDLLESAPASVLEALALILIGKLYRVPVAERYSTRYRRFLNRRHVRRQMYLVRQARGRKHQASPQGRVHDLESIFHDLNARYFGGLLGMPVLGWSRLRSRTMLGHFDPAHNTITISRIFDSPQVPAIALEFLLYHEMLHLKYPVEYCGGRRRVHSARFQQEEKRFPQYHEARLVLKHLGETAQGD